MLIKDTLLEPNLKETYIRNVNLFMGYLEVIMEQTDAEHTMYDQKGNEVFANNVTDDLPQQITVTYKGVYSIDLNEVLALLSPVYNKTGFFRNAHGDNIIRLERG